MNRLVAETLWVRHGIRRDRHIDRLYPGLWVDLVTRVASTLFA